MSNYNTQLQSNNTNLQMVLQTLQTKAAGGGEQATPVISVNSSNGLVTATAGTKSSTHQLAFQSAKTITPSTTSQIAVSSGYYTGGNIIVAAVPTQTKSVTPTTSTQNVTPDSGKFLSKVTVASIPNSYVEPTTTKGATTYTPTTTAQTIASGTYLTGVQTIAGDSNLVASNIKSGVSIFGVSGTLEEGSGGGSGELVDYSENEDAIISRSISGSYFNDRITIIGEAAFMDCSNLTSVNFPACTSIGADAFYNCGNLTTASFPACTSIDDYAFYNCGNLTTASFPVCTSIDNHAFASCTRLTSVSFPACVSIGNGAFTYCTSLTSVSFPACTKIGGYAFGYCTRLTSVNFPACTSIGADAFYNCGNLTTASFPVCTSIDDYAFYNCGNLTTVSFPACTNIDTDAFAYCRTLSSITLGAPIVCTLTNSNAFTSTPYTGYSLYFSGTPYIYVPASLLTSYQTATNWAYFSSYFIGDTSLDNECDDENSNLITFTINGSVYKAENEMTWEEWINSKYNTNGYIISGNYIADSNNERICLNGMVFVIKTDTINSDGSYGYM